MTEIIQGFAMHLHHNYLVEWCYDLTRRKEAIETKPENEIPIREKLFKMLPEEVVAEIPQELRDAEVKWEETEVKREEANATWEKTETKREEVYAKWEEACVEQQKAYNKWKKAYKNWSQAEKDKFHAKWCGCKEWNGKEIVFPK